MTKPSFDIAAAHKSPARFAKKEDREPLLTDLRALSRAI